MGGREPELPLSFIWNSIERPTPPPVKNANHNRELVSKDQETAVFQVTPYSRLLIMATMMMVRVRTTGWNWLE